MSHFCSPVDLFLVLPGYETQARNADAALVETDRSVVSPTAGNVGQGPVTGESNPPPTPPRLPVRRPHFSGVGQCVTITHCLTALLSHSPTPSLPHSLNHSTLPRSPLVLHHSAHRGARAGIFWLYLLNVRRQRVSSVVHYSTRGFKGWDLRTL